MASVSVTVGAENQWTDGVEVKGGFDLSISGTFSATVTVQRSFDNGASWNAVDTFTAPIETYGVQPNFALYRAGVATGNYVSGSPVITLYESDPSR